MLIHILIGLTVGSVTVFVAMMLCALVLTMSDFDATVATPLSNISLAIGAMVGGLVASILHKSKGLVIGAIIGFSMFIIVTIISLIISDGTITVNTPLRLVVMTLLAAVGGIIGVNRSAKRKLV